MLTELFRTGQQLLQVIGMLALLWGAVVLIGAVAAGRSPFDWVKGGALLFLGAYLAGLVQGL
jgi:hypothetical protein